MRHLLLVPAGLIGLLSLVMFIAAAQSRQIGGPLGLGLDFVLLMVIEAILFSAWIICHEIALLHKSHAASPGA